MKSIILALLLTSCIILFVNQASCNIISDEIAQIEKRETAGGGFSIQVESEKNKDESTTAKIEEETKAPTDEKLARKKRDMSEIKEKIQQGFKSASDKIKEGAKKITEMFSKKKKEKRETAKVLDEVPKKPDEETKDDKKDENEPAKKEKREAESGDVETKKKGKGMGKKGKGKGGKKDVEENKDETEKKERKKRQADESEATTEEPAKGKHKGKGKNRGKGKGKKNKKQDKDSKPEDVASRKKRAILFGPMRPFNSFNNNFQDPRKRLVHYNVRQTQETSYSLA
ncbi:hypothetical protein PVAND_006456 [Polypedilum vanderplanki]|uniref:Uncharacterized protein n=1 Tax=Polypedilum vanderplanki TaxID=319348 RepID=A0A9J6C384_POLVA|nr:hypothetical protein PVAND_006456 [Polypedilum vanderplanki]